MDQYFAIKENKMISIKKLHYKHFCKEDISLIENYDKAMADTTQIWSCHHRLETHKYKDRKREEWVERDGCVSRDELKAFGLYYNRPAKELIFMTESDHKKLHKKGSHFSEETKQKMKDAWKKRKLECPIIVSEETKRKMSEARKRYWAEKRKSSFATD